ncbi:MAG: amidohydrolase [Proteobacteria bacterium]|nr:amidohydrolase [Pseudomonadota bacterium]
MSVIDVHNHFFPETFPDLDRRYGGTDWPAVKRTGPDTATVMLGDKPFRDIDAACWDPTRRLADMDRDGVERQVISATPVLFSYQRKPEHALDFARLMNDTALEICARGQGRLLALAQVPLQDVDAACREAERAMRSGHHGVQIGNHVGPKNLDDDGLVAFLHHCADLGAAVLVHPWDMMERERTAKYMMAWTVGMPAETQLAIVSMILGGAFDRLPRSLRLCFAHGGGSFAFLLGRLENAWHHKDTVRGKSEHPPSHYLDRFSVDSAVFDDRTLKFLVDTMGEDRVLLGSDYPFPLGEQRVGALVRESNYLSDAVKAKIVGANVERFLGVG